LLLLLVVVVVVVVVVVLNEVEFPPLTVGFGQKKRRLA